MTLTDLYPRLQPYLLASAWQMSKANRDDAQDVVQDVWLRLVGREFATWQDARRFAIAVLRNIVVDRYRHGKLRQVIYFEEWTVEHHDHYPQEECADLLQRWNDALPTLKPRERQIAGMLAAGYSNEEGADAIGITPNLFRVATKRMRAKLKEAV